MKPIWSAAPPRRRPRRVTKKVESRNGALHFLPRYLRQHDLPFGSLWVMSRRGNVRRSSSFIAGVMSVEHSNRQIERTEFEPGVSVSTIFLGVEHGASERGPLLFETMVFGGQDNGYQWRYATRDEAVKGHTHAVEHVRNHREVKP